MGSGGAGKESGKCWGKAWIPAPALLLPSGVTPGQKEFYFLSLGFLICKMGAVVASISQGSSKNGRTFCGLVLLLAKFLSGSSGNQPFRGLASARPLISV